MIADDHATPGAGSLTYARVLRQSWEMFRGHYLRVAFVAFVLFVPPPLIVAGLEWLRASLEADPGLARGIGYVVGLLMVSAIRLLGPVVYAGYLDEAVGKAYFRGELMPFGAVLRSLPWGRLLVADVIVIAGATIGLGMLVLPGIAFLTLFSLVGPVIVQEGHGIVDAFRRTLHLSLSAWRHVLLLVVALLAVELLLHELVHLAFHHSSLGVQVAASWLVSASIGGVVGLVEVALATELMARRPLAGR